MINDTSQHCAARWCRCGGTIDQYFVTMLQIYCWVCFERIFKLLSIW